METLIPVRIKNEDSLHEILVCSQESDGDIIFWSTENAEPEQYVEIKQEKSDGHSTFIVTRKGKDILSDNDEITERMDEFFLNLTIKKEVENSDGLEAENNPIYHKVDADPYDPKLIRVEPKNFSVQYTCSLIDSGDIDLSPDFQREFVWSDITRKSRLIESLLLRIPIPVFYLVQDEAGWFQVVDGVQRLTVLHDFVKNKFKLKNLEYLKDCEGKFYNKTNESLNPLYIKRIDQTQLTFNIIDPQTPEQVRYDIFRRINTGGKMLNNQEIRNCLERPHVRKLLKEMSLSQEFKKATRGSIKPTRMADREIILRFIAFYLQDHQLFGQPLYKGDMDQYLDGTVEILNHTDEKEFFRIRIAFENAMCNAFNLFGNYAFRKANYINKALFLSWSRVLCDMDRKLIMEKAGSADYKSILSEAINTNMNYANSLSMSTNDSRRVLFNYQMAKQIIDKDNYEEINNREF